MFRIANLLGSIRIYSSLFLFTVVHMSGAFWKINGDREKGKDNCLGHGLMESSRGGNAFPPEMRDWFRVIILCPFFQRHPFSQRSGKARWKHLREFMGLLGRHLGRAGDPRSLKSCPADGGLTRTVSGIKARLATAGRTASRHHVTRETQQPPPPPPHRPHL